MRIFSLLAVMAMVACATVPPAEKKAGTLEVAVSSALQMASVAASEDGRIFVATPQWGGPRHLGVAEVKNGQLVAYPDEKWNAWDGDVAHAAEQFVCAHAVYVHGGALWVVDPASPEFSGAVPEGLKLVKIDLATNQVSHVYALGGAAPKASYVQDVRIDDKRGLAYLADAMGGALITVDLKTGAFKRHFEGVAALQAEPGYTATIQGKPWLGADGQPPKIGVDGLELDPAKDVIYLHPLDGKTLWRIPAAALERDDASKLEQVTSTGAADGLLLGAVGALLVTSLEDDSVKQVAADGRVTTLVTDKRLAWPDTLAWEKSGSLLISASQIHRGAGFNGGADKTEKPFQVFRFTP
ncbi:MAG: L-dopachrome tautomerase-related protein [Myxococcaceae bacterium]